LAAQQLKVYTADRGVKASL